MKQIRVVIKYMGTVFQTLTLPLSSTELVRLRLLSQRPPVEDQRPDFISDSKGLKPEKDLGELLPRWEIEGKPYKSEFDQYPHRLVDRNYGEQVRHLQGPVKVVTIDFDEDGNIIEFKVAEERV